MIVGAAGHVIVGGVTSTVLVIVCTQVALLPHASVALYVLKIVSVQPDVLVWSPTCVITIGPVQLSVAVTSVMSGAGTGPLHIMVGAPGQVIVGGVTSTVLVIVCTQVALLPQPSVALYVLNVVSVQPDVLVLSLTKVIVIGPVQLSVAVTNVTSGGGTGPLHTMVGAAGHVITGGVTSTVLVIVCTQVALLPQPSVALYVLNVVSVQPDVLVLSLTKVIVIGPVQLSVAVTSVMSGAGTGPLHIMVGAPGQVIVGGVTSTVLVIVCTQVALLPQPSVALYVLNVVSVQPDVLVLSLTKVIVIGPVQLSVAVTSVTSGGGTGPLHTMVGAAGHVIVGGVTSTVLVIVCTQVALLPQPSVALYVLNVVSVQPDVLVLSLTKVIVIGPVQLSVSVTSVMSGAGTGPLHIMVGAPGQVIVGGVTSTVLVIVCTQVALLPQPSVALYVLNVVSVQPDVLVLSLTKVIVIGPVQLSVAVTSVMSGAGTGPLHIMVGAPGQVIVGGVTSTVLVIVCTQVALLPQPSVALYVLNVVSVQPDVLVLSLTKVIVIGPVQLSVAVTSVMSGAGTGPLHIMVGAPGQVIVGGVTSTVLVIVCTQVALLPQPSVALYVLNVVSVQPDVLVLSLTKVIVIGPVQLSVAVTSVTSGAGTGPLHTIVGAAGQVIVGGVTSTVLVIVCTHVALLPQPSVALYVLNVVSVQPDVLVWSPTCVITIGPVQLSVAVTSVMSGGGTGPLQMIVGAAGHVIVGGVTSTVLVIVCTQG